MAKRWVRQVGKQGRSVGERREGRSPFTATSVLIAGGLFISTLGYLMLGTRSGGDASWLQSLAPGALTVTGSYLAGFFIGWGARRTIKLTSIITGVALALVGMFVSWGWDGSTVQGWVNSASAWVGENVEGVGRYFASLLPSATAATAGGVLGFKRK